MTDYEFHFQDHEVMVRVTKPTDMVVEDYYLVRQRYRDAGDDYVEKIYWDTGKLKEDGFVYMDNGLRFNYDMMVGGYCTGWHLLDRDV